MFGLRIRLFFSYSLYLVPMAIVAFLAVSEVGNAQVESFHLVTPGGMAVEPYVRLLLENRYSSAATGFLTGAIGLSWWLSRVEARRIERRLDAAAPRRRTH